MRRNLDGATTGSLTLVYQQEPKDGPGVDMNQVLSRVRPVRAYLLMTYDFAAWVGSFVAMATLQF